VMIPVREGRITLEHLVGEIGEIVAGQKRGRLTPQDVTIYKSHGVAIQDVAAAHLVYQKAVQREMGTKADLYQIL
jgi:alanine dehydrogenase